MNLNIFESFAGIGSQYKALELIKKEKKIKENKEINLNVVGIAEWDINSLIAYHRIHRKENIVKDRENILNQLFSLKETEENKTQIKELVVKNIEEKMNKGWVFSNDTKTPLKLNSFKRMDYEKLIQFFVASEFYNNASTVFNLKNRCYLTNLLQPIDIFTYSFPCQAISLQGKQEGLAEDSDTSSSLLWQIKYFLEEIKKLEKAKKLSKLNQKPIKTPEYLLMENVAALFNQKNSVEWNKFKVFLDEIGYETVEIVLKASHFGIPQNRDRAFALSIKKHNPKLNEIKESFLNLKNIGISEDNVEEKQKTFNVIDNFLDKNLTKEQLNTLKIEEEYQPQKEKFKEAKITKNNICKIMLENYTTFSSENAVYHSKKSIAPTITAQGAQSRLKVYDEDNDCIRYLTSKEHLLLMGFEEEDYINLIKENDDKKIMKDVLIKKMAGNSIVVNVLKKIFETIVI